MSSSLLRPLRDDDAEQVAELFYAAYGESRAVSPDEVRRWLATGAADQLRVLDVDGRVTGYGDISVEEYVELDVAAPGHCDVFLDWAEHEARSAGVARVRAGCLPGNELGGVLVGRGYRPWHSSLRMEIELNERPEPTLDVVAYRDADHDALIAAMNESFAEDEMWRTITPENFRTYYLEAPGFDPDLWSLIWDERELAAFVLPFTQRDDTETTLGWVRTLGVRQPWRRRGLGSGLLQVAFAGLYDRGRRRVGLGVDAQNPTGAVALYEGAGMRAVHRWDNYVLEL